MSQETYSLPSGPTARYGMQHSAISISAEKAGLWNIPQEFIVEIRTASAEYESAYATAANRGTQSPAATALRDEKWDVLSPKLSTLYNQYLINNPLLSANDRMALGIHTLQGNGGPALPAPTTTPIVTLVSEEISVLHVVYADSATPASHSKPGNVAFCELAYRVGDQTPNSINECPERYNIARSHEGIVFAAEQRGKKIYAFARWVTKNGKQGPWSGIVSAIIP